MMPIPVDEPLASTVARDLWATVDFDAFVPVRPVTRASVWTWMRRYPSARRAVLERVYRQGINHHPSPALHSFIKREKAIVGVDFSKDAIPRTIQASDDDFLLRTGPWVQKLTKRVARRLTLGSWLDGRHVTYSCGMTAEAVGDWFTRASRALPNCVFVCDDQSKYDRHIHEHAFDAVDRWFKRVLPRRTAHLLSRRHYTPHGIQKGVTANGNRYSVPYTMGSGRPDTSLTDTLLNVAMKTRIFGVGTPWLSIVCGDDSVVCVDRDFFHRLGGWDHCAAMYSAFGFEATGFVHDHLLDVDFCNSYLMETDQGLLLVPKLGRLLSKAFYDIVDRTPEQSRAWLRGVCVGMSQYSACFPMLSALCDNLMGQLGDGSLFIEDNPYAFTCAIRHTATLSSYYDYLDRHYGVSVEAAHSAGHSLATIAHYALSDNPWVAEIARRDA
jgi:hypothetical protein